VKVVRPPRPSGWRRKPGFGETTVKAVNNTTVRIGGERSERAVVQTSAFADSDLLSLFHPVAQKYDLLLLLSTFTHTHANARAYARKRPRMRGVVKVEGSRATRQPARRPRRRLSASSTQFAPPSPVVQGRDTWPHVGPRRACQSGRAGRSARRRPMVPSRRCSVGDARGNSRRCRESLFFVSGFSSEEVLYVARVGVRAAKITRPSVVERGRRAQCMRS
jgi:hypothetical protein